MSPSAEPTGAKPSPLPRIRSLISTSFAKISADARVWLLGFCLMTNHVHLIAVLEGADALAVLLRRVHGRYAP